MKNEMTKLVHLLNAGKVLFEFKKKDGSTRTALGTKRLDLMPDMENKERFGKKKAGAVTFYDLEIGEWRCFLEGTSVRVLG
jgi:hypothetical protein